MIAPASTGSDNRSNTVVMKTDQTKRFNRSQIIPGARMLITVVIKFTAPKIEEMPARWREKMARSTPPPAWAIGPLRGG